MQDTAHTHQQRDTGLSRLTHEAIEAFRKAGIFKMESPAKEELVSPSHVSHASFTCAFPELNVTIISSVKSKHYLPSNKLN